MPRLRPPQRVKQSQTLFFLCPHAMPPPLWRIQQVKPGRQIHFFIHASLYFKEFMNTSYFLIKKRIQPRVAEALAVAQKIKK